MDYPTQVFHLIGHEIFKLLPYNDIFTCRTICRQFKRVVDDPFFCLKLLKTIGHPDECNRKWIDLIQKCKEVGISNDTFVIILLQKFGNLFRLVPKTEDPKHKQWEFAMPPIYHAIKSGHIDAVKAISQVTKDCFEPLPHYYWGTKWRPFIEAVENGHLEIAEFIDCKIKNQMPEESRNLPMWQDRSECMSYAISGVGPYINSYLVKSQ